MPRKRKERPDKNGINSTITKPTISSSDITGTSKRRRLNPIESDPPVINAIDNIPSASFLTCDTSNASSLTVPVDSDIADTTPTDSVAVAEILMAMSAPSMKHLQPTGPSTLEWFASITADQHRIAHETPHSAHETPQSALETSLSAHETRHSAKETPLSAQKETPLSTHKTPISAQPPEMYSIQCQTPRTLVGRRSVLVQAMPETREFGTQTDADASVAKLILPTLDNLDNSFNDSFVSDISHNRNDDSDADWLPDDEDFSPSEDEGTCTNEEQTPATENKFLVFESSLDELINRCIECGGRTSTTKSVSGSYVKCTISCERCESVRVWGSQPQSGTMPYGNLLLAAGIMFSGASPIKVINAMNFSHVQFLSRKTYFTIQSSYLVPSVESVYQRLQTELIADIILSGEEVHAGGDARCCSPGHTAKYSSYSIMDLTRSKIVDVQLVQSNEVKNSYAMELEGLKRCLAFLADKNVNVTDLVTDRHSQVKKYMRENTDIRHWFDVWHVAKGVFKKLEAAGKKKYCADVGDWARSISNHLYWCAASSEGNGDLVQQKWLSILNHVTNVHEGHGDLFTECAHGPIEQDRVWLKKGFKTYMELEKVVKGRLLVTDVKKLSPAEQTSSLESYHKVVCFFAPKFVHFEFPQMQARIRLSVLHFNENSNRAQAVKKNGERQYRISYPKARKGQAVAADVKVAQTFGK